MSSDAFSSFLKDLADKMPDLAILPDEPMRGHTTFRIGGAVRALVRPKSVEELIDVIGAIEGAGLRHMVLGNGSNVLFSDEPHEMIVVSTEDVSGVYIEGELVHCGAGARLAAVARAAMEASLTGFEFAQGIPGTIGGAVYMNAGAYGGEMADVVERVTYLDGERGVRVISGRDCGFAYRRSIFEDGGVILSALLRLEFGERSEICERMNDLARRRREKQPLEYPSAGSTFKRPAGGYAAAMIDEAGLRGLRVGDAEVSQKHAGFIVNLGSATFEDVISLMETVRERVAERFGVTLLPEVKIIR